jgi:hypothetical protein
MTYFGHQFRMARAATRLQTREVCAEAEMSLRTLFNVEAADAIEYGTKQRGKFDQATIAKLVRLYQGHGVAFLSASRGGAGIRYLPR